MHVLNCSIVAIAIILTSCIPRGKTAPKLPTIKIETKGIETLYQDGLVLAFSEGSDDIKASYKFEGGPFFEAAPESERVHFTPKKIKASDVLRSLEASGFCQISGGHDVADCGDTPLGVYRHGSSETWEWLHLKATDCEPSYIRLCEDGGITALLEQIRKEIPRK